MVRYMRITTSGEEYKLPNDLKPLYARMMMELEEDLEGFFDTRALTR